MLFNPLPILLVLTGLYLLVKLKFFYILHPIKTLSLVRSELKRRENITSLLLALAGTLGVGNLLGVAIGIIIGGPGSLFWLFVSGIPSSVIKYSEVVACSDLNGRAVGMSELIGRTYHRCGKLMSSLYSAACLLLAFIMGACLQTRTVVDSLVLGVGADGVSVALIATVIVLISICRGAKFVSKITAIVVPMTTIMYITMSFSVICVNFSNMSSALSSILSGAFSPLAAGGGIIALLVSDSMREGFARGMLSNEAGAGTSTLAHATGGSLHPARRGIFGIIEVFFDTAFLCMMSGFSILLAVPDPSSYDNAMALLLAAVTGSLGEWLALPLVLSVCAFAYSTVVCWYYYGASSISLLIGKPGGIVFGILYLAFVFVGCIVPSATLVCISDALLLLLSLLTLPTVIKSSDRVLRLSEQIGLVGYISE